MGNFRDLTGQKFGRLTALNRAQDYLSPSGRRRTMWRCACDCGKECTIEAYNLSHGKQVSCGCYRDEQLSRRQKKHGMTDTRLYFVWCGIKNRCYNPNVYEYRFYGARGISMCEQWKNDFLVFYNWAIECGYDISAPRGMYTIDRIDCNGNYCPENCRWVTQMEQANNLRSNHIVEYDGETNTIAEWSRITGINQYKIRNRIVCLGWSARRALTTV